MSTGTGHAGDITPEQALEALTSTEGAVLVDVRTTAEWENVGIPDLAAVGGTPVLLEWQMFPTMAPNPDFCASLVDELDRRGAGPETPVLFLCRSGARSAAAARAMTALGYARSFNIAGGFEGSPALGLPGWKNSGHPWTRP
jgi:rhodanese-related sulfurtransferase